MQQRYYDPIAGRFLSVDPITTDANSGSHFGRYDYVNNNPFKYTDPDGRAKSEGGGFGFGWETVSSFADSAITGGYGLQFKEAAKAGNYGEAGLKLTAGVVYGVLNVATLGEGAAIVAAASKGSDLCSQGLGEASSLVNAARLHGQLAGQEIAGGHAFEKHVVQQAEFKGLGIGSREQFASHIENVVNNPTASRQLSDGRSAYWDSTSGTVVIRNPRAADGGTAIQPANSRAYFDGLR